MLVAALGIDARPRVVQGELWSMTPNLFAVNAKPSLAGNLARAIAQGFRALSPR